MYFLVLLESVDNCKYISEFLDLQHLSELWQSGTCKTGIQSRFLELLQCGSCQTAAFLKLTCIFLQFCLFYRLSEVAMCVSFILVIADFLGDVSDRLVLIGFESFETDGYEELCLLEYYVVQSVVSQPTGANYSCECAGHNIGARTPFVLHTHTFPTIATYRFYFLVSA